MRTLHLSIWILIFWGSVSSCNDYLEAEPYSFTSPENFYKSASDAEIALIGVYSILSGNSVQGTGNNSTYSRQLMIMLNGATDEAVVRDGLNQANYSPWGNAGFTSQNIFLNESWFYFYAGINRANYLIEKLPEIQDIDFTDSRRLEIEAEAKVMRGFYHMMLSMMHGAIPVYNTSIQDETMARKPIQEVYVQIISDYEFGYDNLPDRASVSGHVNKWTAGALLMKAYTYLASAKKFGLSNFDYEPNSFEWVNENDYYQTALAISNQIISSSGYILIDNYDYLFREATKSYQYQECLLTAEASSNANLYVINMIVNAFVPQGNNAEAGGGYGWYRPLGELWNKYNENDFRRNHNITGNLVSTRPTEEIDGYRYYIPNSLTNTNNGFLSIGKYRMIDPLQKEGPAWSSFISLPLLRYADVMLMHAEALYFTGNEPDARSVLTELRQRSVIAPATVSDLNLAYYKSDFVDELLDERSRELCFENWRRIDLARFNKYDEVIDSLTTDAGYYNTIVPTIKQNWKSERVWFPIPIQQIDVNPNLEQNPGY
ncbi:MAG: RagB/SusD family nutrient uptake outer membrane protein [Cyclobacteriaceae bacterium]